MRGWFDDVGIVTVPPDTPAAGPGTPTIPGAHVPRTG